MLSMKMNCCLEDCLNDIDLAIYETITIYAIIEATMQIGSKEYLVYDISGEGYYIVACDHSHLTFLPVDADFNVWVIKGWDNTLQIDPILHKRNEQLCINIIGESKEVIKKQLETAIAGVFTNALKARVLYSIENSNVELKSLYPVLHAFEFLRYVDTVESCN